MRIKGILFDFDGTIANTIDLIIATFEHTCREVLGFTPEREKICGYLRPAAAGGDDCAFR